MLNELSCLNKFIIIYYYYYYLCTGDCFPVDILGITGGLLPVLKYRYRGPIIFPSLFHIGLPIIKHN